MRLMPTLAAEPGSRFLFGMAPGGGLRSIEEAPRFVLQLLDWFGIPLERCDAR